MVGWTKKPTQSQTKENYYILVHISHRTTGLLQINNNTIYLDELDKRHFQIS